MLDPAEARREPPQENLEVLEIARAIDQPRTFRAPSRVDDQREIRGADELRAGGSSLQPERPGPGQGPEGCLGEYSAARPVDRGVDRIAVDQVGAPAIAILHQVV